MDSPSDVKDSKSCILFVGEGDFSFAANYITKVRDSNEMVYASCLSDGSLTETQEKNIKIIKENGGIVFADVDATMLDLHPEIKKVKFSRIIFNFPHIPGKMNIRKNRILVKEFFISATKVLEDSGLIWVTLCKGQGGTDVDTLKRKWCDTWQVVSLASSAKLILYQIKSFDAKGFQMYKCTGFRGLQKPFHTEGALTHIFKYGSPVDWICEDTTKNYLNIDLYFESCKTLHRRFYTNFCQPSFKVLTVMKDIAGKIFSSICEKSNNDLFICKMNLSNSDFNNILGGDFCEDCAKYLFFEVLLNIKSSSIVCMTCNISCIKMINISKNPFHHLLSYFSTDAEYLLKCLPILLDNLKDLFVLKKIETEFSFQNYVINNKKYMKTLMHKTNITTTEEFGVKTILN